MAPFHLATCADLRHRFNPQHAAITVNASHKSTVFMTHVPLVQAEQPEIASAVQRCALGAAVSTPDEPSGER